MSTSVDAQNVSEGGAESALEGGSYEVIKRRLSEQARILAERAEALNQKRTETFGGTELQVAGNERVRTENNCIPRDIIALGDKLLKTKVSNFLVFGCQPYKRIENFASIQTSTFTPHGV